MAACFLFIDYFIVQYGEPPFPFRVDSLQFKKHITPERKFFKLKVENGKLRRAAVPLSCRQFVT